jgi:hypothetical protein
MPLTLTANLDSQFVSIGISHLRISAGSFDCGLREIQAFAQDDRELGPFKLHLYDR